MIIKMTIPERLHTMGMLPKEGNFLTLRVIRELKSKIGFSSDEIFNYKIVEEDNLIKWDASVPSDLDISFSEVELDIIKASLIKINKEEKLNMDLFTIYEKFIMR